MSRIVFAFLIVLLPAALSPAHAQTRSEAQLTLIPEAEPDVMVLRDRKVDNRTGLPLVLFGTDFTAQGSTPEAMALAFLNARGASLGIGNVDETLIHASTRETPGGYRVRFNQVIDGIPVFRSSVALSLDRTGRVVFVVNDYKSGVRLESVASKSGSAAAAAAAVDYLGVDGQQIRHQEDQLTVFASGGRGQLAHRVRMVTAKGAWEVLVDAKSGQVFRAESLAHFVAGPDWSRPRAAVSSAGVPSAPTTTFRVDGTGMVFDPDPMTAAQAFYGQTADLQDNNDGDNPVLDGLRKEVPLRDIRFDGTTFDLIGPYAQLDDFDPPFLGTFSQSTDQFHFTRSQPQFEGVNIYHHLDQSLRYINEVLGFSVMPLQYSGGVRYDPQGLEGAVNAQYLFTGQLRFGEGGADMGEDPDVILHELGHGIHDWITDGNLSSTTGLSEGSGDYWAASYTRSLGLWPEGSTQKDVMGRWGGRPFFTGRRVDYSGRFPFDLTGAIHTDGQIWSTALIAIWDELGGETTDRLFLEALSMLTSSSNTEDAAEALLTADTTLNAGANSALILDKLVERGFLFRAALAGAGRAGPAPLSVSFFDLSTFGTGSANSWSWDFNGDGVIDATGQNPRFTYSEPGLYDVTLTASNGIRTETTTLRDYVSVNAGVYVWEGPTDTGDRSGTYIAEQLTRAGLRVHLARTPQIHPSLSGYQAVFLSFGPYQPQAPPTPLQQIPANVVRQYVLGGGKLYLEGGDALGFDQVANADLLAAFGIAQSADGSNSAVPVTNLQGQAGSLADGFQFNGSRQTANTSVDQFLPMASARAMFVQDGYGVVGVQNQNSAGGRSVAMSYTLADLEDDGTNARYALLNDILDFFGVATSTGLEAPDEVPLGLELSEVYPNPLRSGASVQLTVSQAAKVSLSLYDAIGRQRAELVRGDWMAAGVHEVRFSSEGLPSGSYFLRAETASGVRVMPLVIVR